MQTITSERMKIITTLDQDGYALPGGGKTSSDFKAGFLCSMLSGKQGPDLTTEQRKEYIKTGGCGYAKHDA